MPRFAEIVLNLPVDRAFHYEVPDEWNESLQIGSRVRVPFRNRELEGVCVGFVAEPEIPFVRRIAKLLDEQPAVDPSILQLSRWLAERYASSWGEALFATIPPGARKRPSGRKKTATVSLGALISEAPKEITLTPEQTEALRIIEQGPGTVLLHGVTAGGKTEIYLRAIERLRKEGCQSIVLVPEIALTPQTVSRFHARFSRIAVLHSMLTESERGAQWRAAQRGEVDVIIGARSAVFAPVRKLGLIVIDEEHEPAYKQDRAPRYHAREVAIHRATTEKGTVVLGSATPSLESAWRARTGEFRYARISHRIGDLHFPPVDIIDLASERRELKRQTLLSRRLRDMIRETVTRKEQVILFLNRRGYTTHCLCNRCGWVFRCRRCEIALAFHKTSDEALCHYCNRSAKMPETCPECKLGKLSRIGAGTEKVEEEVRALFPEYRVLRMDSDAMKTRGNYGRAIQGIWKGECDIVVGTQMIAKGLDVPNVTAVGVISADTAFHLPDFRSAERTFQLITQVAGRAGRGPSGGRVLVQTFNPAHYSITCASREDYEGFLEKELEQRRDLGYPPFRSLVRILFQGRDEALLMKTADQFVKKFRERVDELFAPILGPAPAPLHRIKNRFRVHCMIKTAELSPVLEALRIVVPALSRSRAVQIDVDVDPQQTL